jgi:hypothetical protein
MTNDEIFTEINATLTQLQALASELLKTVGATSAFVYQIKKKIDDEAKQGVKDKPNELAQ